MSFSADVKTEISRIVPKNHCCCIAELAGLIVSCGSVVLAGGGKLGLKFSSENPAEARHIKALLKQAEDIQGALRVLTPSFGRKSHAYELTVQDGQSAESLLMKAGILLREGGRLGIADRVDPQLLKKKCCRKACLRGMYLGSGSMSAPEKSYNIELSFGRYGAAVSCKKLIASFEGLSAGLRQRRGRYVVYVRNGEMIKDILGIMGAHSHLLEFENVRILKGVRAKAAGESNFDEANITRALQAADRQNEDIELIEEYLGLENLPEELTGAALTRKYHPAASLSELGELMMPPVCKTTVAGRMKKLSIIAEDLRRQYELSV